MSWRSLLSRKNANLLQGLEISSSFIYNTYINVKETVESVVSPHSPIFSPIPLGKRKLRANDKAISPEMDSNVVWRRVKTVLKRVPDNETFGLIELEVLSIDSTFFF